MSEWDQLWDDEFMNWLASTDWTQEQLEFALTFAGAFYIEYAVLTLDTLRQRLTGLLLEGLDGKPELLTKRNVALLATELHHPPSVGMREMRALVQLVATGRELAREEVPDEDV